MVINYFKSIFKLIVVCLLFLCKFAIANGSNSVEFNSTIYKKHDLYRKFKPFELAYRYIESGDAKSLNEILTKFQNEINLYEPIQPGHNVLLDFARVKKYPEIIKLLANKMNVVKNNDERIFLNFYWTKNSVPEFVKNNLFEWQKYLNESESNAEVLLWVDKKTVEMIRMYWSEDCIYEAIDFFNEKINFKLKTHSWRLLGETSKTQSIRLIEIENILEYYKIINPNLVYYYNKLVENNLHSVAAELAKMMILNEMPGVFLDPMIPQWQEENKFFKSLNEFENLFLNNGYSTHKYIVLPVVNCSMTSNILIAFQKNTFENLFHIYKQKKLYTMLEDVERLLSNHYKNDAFWSFSHEGLRHKDTIFYYNANDILGFRMNQRFYYKNFMDYQLFASGVVDQYF